MIDEVLLGHVLSAGCGQAPGTQALRLAGLPLTIPATTVNKVCASGMKAVALGAGMIAAGQAQCVLAGGMESMSRAPFALSGGLRGPNRGLRTGDQSLVDLLLRDGLSDAETGAAMGEAGERVAERLSISREEMDAFGRASFERARAAAELLEREEIVACPGRDGGVSVVSDEGPGVFNPGRMATLRTPFRPQNGRITAATASQLTDGAAVLLLMSGRLAEELAIRPVARIVAWADAGVADAMDFPLAPAAAIPRALEQAQLTLADMDLFEINEAFAMVPVAISRQLSVPLDRTNVLGGAVALGHPLGASGARIIGTLLTALRTRGLARGCAAVCNGGGGASALILELVSQE